MATSWTPQHSQKASRFVEQIKGFCYSFQPRKWALFSIVSGCMFTTLAVYHPSTQTDDARPSALALAEAVWGGITLCGGLIVYILQCRGTKYSTFWTLMSGNSSSGAFMGISRLLGAEHFQPFAWIAWGWLVGILEIHFYYYAVTDDNGNAITEQSVPLVRDEEDRG